MTSATAPLVVHALAKRYGRNQVLDGLELEVQSGEAVAVVGPNGAGKSTLLGCICGTVIPDRGRVEIWGHELSSEPIPARTRLRYLPQEVDVALGLTGREILSFHARVFSDPHGLERAVEFADLGEAIDHLATTYSVGMRKRLRFAALLPGAGRLFVLDEPFAGVDPRGRERMLATLVEAKNAGAGLVVAAHEAETDELIRLGARTLTLGGDT